ncbi:hypothetical protein L218DRAFT_968557, partial [Marasmius fiardii PR-910]
LLTTQNGSKTHLLSSAPHSEHLITTLYRACTHMEEHILDHAPVLNSSITFFLTQGPAFGGHLQISI